MHLHVFGALGSKGGHSWQVFSYAQVLPEWRLFVGLELSLALCWVEGWGLSEAGRERPGPPPAPVAWNRSLGPSQVSLVQEWKVCGQLPLYLSPSYSWKTPDGSLQSYVAPGLLIPSEFTFYLMFEQLV